MATASLNWTPSGGANSTGQQVQYKLNSTGSSGVWSNGPLVSPVATTAQITGLQDNVLYNFRVENICSDGGPTPSALDTKINITCPAVTWTSDSTTLSFSFAHLGGDITKYLVELLDSSGNTLVNSQTITTLNTTITGTFTGLSPSTSYTTRITVFAGSGGTYSRTCPTSLQSTAAPSPCNAPTGVSASMA